MGLISTKQFESITCCHVIIFISTQICSAPPSSHHRERRTNCSSSHLHHLRPLFIVLTIVLSTSIAPSFITLARNQQQRGHPPIVFTLHASTYTFESDSVNQRRREAPTQSLPRANTCNVVVSRAAKGETWRQKP